MNGNLYLDMLQNYAIPQIPQGYVFQQDGAPLHFALHIRDHLNECFPQQWIGQSGPTAWPPRFNPTRLLFWGIHKRHCVQDCSGRFGDLHRRIVAACATVTPEMLRNTQQEL